MFRRQVPSIHFVVYTMPLLLHKFGVIRDVTAATIVPLLLTDRLYIEVTLLTGIRGSESITEHFVHKDCLRLQL